MKTQTILFNNLVDFLIKHNYNIELVKEPNYYFAKISGHGIKGGFSTPNLDTYYEINGRIAFDHKKMFDRWTYVTCSYPLPSNEAELEYVLSKMKIVGSNDFYKGKIPYEEVEEEDYPGMRSKNKNKQKKQI